MGASARKAGVGSVTTRSRFKPAPAKRSEPGVVVISGKIKWFGVSKGYGFIKPDDGSADVFVLVSTLRDAGIESFREGSHIVCEVITRERGRQAAKIVSVDESTAVPVKGNLRARNDHEVAEAGDFKKAIVKWFNVPKGYGFVVHGESDVFVHAETLQACGMIKLQPGQEVLVRYGRSSKGLTVAEIKPCD